MMYTLDGICTKEHEWFTATIQGLPKPKEDTDMFHGLILPVEQFLY